MAKFEVRYGLGGGFGGPGEWEEVEETSLDNAEKYAYECACEEYDSYGGLHGLDDIESIIEEEECSEEDAEIIWRENRESWLAYEAREIK